MYVGVLGKWRSTFCPYSYRFLAPSTWSNSSVLSPTNNNNTAEMGIEAIALLGKINSFFNFRILLLIRLTYMVIVNNNHSFVSNQLSQTIRLSSHQKQKSESDRGPTSENNSSSRKGCNRGPPPPRARCSLILQLKVIVRKHVCEDKF